MFYLLLWMVPVLGVVGLLIIGLMAVNAGAQSIADLDAEPATLCCFHCGRETTVGRKTCEHCGQELQS